MKIAKNRHSIPGKIQQFFARVFEFRKTTRQSRQDKAQWQKCAKKLVCFAKIALCVFPVPEWRVPAIIAPIIIEKIFRVLEFSHVQVCSFIDYCDRHKWISKYNTYVVHTHLYRVPVIITWFVRIIYRWKFYRKERTRKCSISNCTHMQPKGLWVRNHRRLFFSNDAFRSSFQDILLDSLD